MTEPHTDVGEAEFLQKLPDIARMEVDPEPLNLSAMTRFEVDPPPAHDAVDLTIRAASTICAN